jgi:hypothetical protein
VENQDRAIASIVHRIVIVFANLFRTASTHSLCHVHI